MIVCPTKNQLLTTLLQSSPTNYLSIPLLTPATMDPNSGDLHMLFFPFIDAGHMLPSVDMAKLFAARGAHVTLLTTPGNAAALLPSLPPSIRLHTIPFPASDFGLPDDADARPSSLPYALRPNFFHAVAALRQPFDDALASLLPDCVVSGTFMPWTHHVAAARNIPRLVFHGTSNFANCAADAFRWGRGPVGEEGESVVLPGLPHRVEMPRGQVLDFRKLAGTPMEMLMELMEEVAEAEAGSYGAVMNSFYELEPEYVEHHRWAMGRRTWNVGPVSLCGEESATLPGGCAEWLEGKPAGSVVYVCFGSRGALSAAQMREMALGLEASGHSFVWVVGGEGRDWVPEGYEGRIGGRGMVMRGWAPQLLILNHAAVGGFVTHCGWNSSLEAIGAGLPVVTWPLQAEQFYNEKFLVEVLRIGVKVGSKALSFKPEERAVVKADAVEGAVRRLMGGGEEATERRRRAKELAEKARRAVEEGGSSFDDVGKLMNDLAVDRKKVRA